MDALLIPIEAPEGEPSVMRALSLSRSGVNQLLRSGELKTVKVGRRRFTTPKLLREYVDGLEIVGPDAA